MVAPYEPYKKPEDGGDNMPATDFASLTAFVPVEPSELPELRPHTRTDYASLTKGEAKQRRMEMPNTPADHFVNIVTPVLIYALVMSVLMFLLNVRFIYTSVFDTNLRYFAFFFVLGVVALNRLIARDGSHEAFLYAFALGLTVAFYTFSTTELFNVGAVTRNFMNSNAYAATLFNMTVVILLWWMVNRLTHECCVDENSVAGDIGLFSATAEGFRKRLQLAAAPPPQTTAERMRAADIDEPWYGISAYDPMDFEKRQTTKTRSKPALDFSARLPKRHPGMALLYFSVPVMIVFSLGLPIIQHMGMSAVRMGAYYMYVYTFCALALLTITCLRQLRAYFRVRYVNMPQALPWFWLGTAAMMILIIMWGAVNLPMPSLPPVAYVDKHEVDVFNPIKLRVELQPVTPPTMSFMERYQLAERLDIVAKIAIVLVFLYLAIKGLQWLVDYMLRNRHDMPSFVNRIITALAWLLFKLWPTLRAWALPQWRPRIQRAVSLSIRFDNPYTNPNAPPMPIRDHIAYAYDALRALAVDVGMPPKPSMTPYEFLENYPKELVGMQKEAEEIIRLYVIAAYSDFETDQRLEDRLRKFWQSFRVTRNAYVR